MSSLAVYGTVICLVWFVFCVHNVSMGHGGLD